MKKWASHLYNNCYCYERKGVVYTYVNHKRQTTGLKWHKDNRERALEILHERYNNYNIYEMRFEKLFELFINYKKSRISLTRLNQYKNSCRFISRNYFVSEHILITRNIEENLKKFTDLKPTTTNYLLSSLKSIFNYGISCGYLTVNPIKPYLFKKSVHKKVPSFSQEELDLLLEHLKGTELGRLVKFISITGLRIAEALQIKEQDIFEDYFVIHGKGGRIRNFPLKAIPEVKQYLKPFALDAGSAQYRFRKVLKELNLYTKERSFHGLRKFAINTYIQNGITPIVATEMFGHTIKVMEKYYIEMVGAEKLNEIVKNQLNSYTQKS